MSEWISTDDRLPVYGEPCLIVICGVTQNVTYMRDGSDDSGDWFEPYHYEDLESAAWLIEVSHWRPIPVPPSE